MPDSHEQSEEENVEEPEVNQEEHQESLTDHITPMLKQTRQQKFSWTEEADRCVKTLSVIIQ